MEDAFKTFLADQPKSQHNVVVLLKPLENEVRWLTPFAPLFAVPAVVHIAARTMVVNVLLYYIKQARAIVGAIRRKLRNQASNDTSSEWSEGDVDPMPIDPDEVYHTFGDIHMVDLWEQLWKFAEMVVEPKAYLTQQPEKMGSLRSLLNLKRLAKHGAILVYGIVYEFGDNGLRRLDEGAAERFNERIPVGSTFKKWSDFESWISTTGDLYKAEQYSASTNNCHQFVEAACKFLDVQVPDSLQYILDWLDGRGAEYVERLKARSTKSTSSTATSSSNSSNT